MSLIAFLVVATMPQARDIKVTFAKRSPQPSLEVRREQWTKSLVDIVAMERTTMVVDVTLEDSPPVQPTKAGGEFAAKLLAQSIRRKWTPEKGVQLFLRPTADEPELRQERHGELLQWLSSLDATTIKRLSQGRFSTAELTPEARNALFLEIAMFKDLLPPLTNNQTGMGVRIDSAPTVSVIDPKTGKRIKFHVSWPDTPTQPAEIPQMPTKQSVKPLSPPVAGPLDFGKGVIKSLKEIVKEAETTFAVKYFVDGRLADRPFFFSGGFTKERFDDTLRRITTVSPSAPKIPRNVDLAETTRNLLGGPLSRLTGDETVGASDLTKRDFQANRKVNASDVLKAFPGFANTFKKLGIDPNATVTLGAGIEIKVDTGHTRVLRTIPGSNGSAPVTITSSPFGTVVVGS